MANGSGLVMMLGFILIELYELFWMKPDEWQLLGGAGFHPVMVVSLVSDEIFLLVKVLKG